jgi:hypothetical protein
MPGNIQRNLGGDQAVNNSYQPSENMSLQRLATAEWGNPQVLGADRCIE